MSDKSKIVLTGANGFLGSHLVDRLLKENYEVHCIVRKTSNLKWLNGKDVQLHPYGLLDIDSLIPIVKGADYVFHLAGTVSAFKYEGYHFGNVTLTKNLLEAIVGSKTIPKKIVVTSSLAVSGPSIDQSKLETDAQPVSYYGKSKLEQENLCKTYFNTLPIAIARPSIIYGPRDTEFFEFVKTVNMGLVPLVGFKDKPISSIYIDDLIEGLYKMALSENTGGQIYHIASKEVLTWRNLGEYCAASLEKKPMYLSFPHFVIQLAGFVSGSISKISKKPATFDSQKANEGIQEGWVGSVEKAKKDFGFEAAYSFKTGIERTIAWYKEKKWI